MIGAFDVIIVGGAPIDPKDVDTIVAYLVSIRGAK